MHRMAANADSPSVDKRGAATARMAVVALTASLAAAVPLVAQPSPDWLSGVWHERINARAKGVSGPAGTLQVAVSTGLLRVLENGAAGEDLRCRLDGTEMQYRLTRSKAAIDYTLECLLGPQSVEMTGTMTVGATDGFPPREFELRKKFELAKDGSVRKQDQLWGLLPGLGRMAVSDTTTVFARRR
jgi:hypothetical protein